MEETVGKIWHNWITKAADKTYPHAAVELAQVNKSIGILFRALGGDRGLSIEATSATAQTVRRNWLQRIAGSATEVELCWLDDEALRLPEQLAVFPEAELNRELYLWLAALTAQTAHQQADTLPWFQQNQQLTQQVLKHFPGFRARYQRLLAAQLALRPDISTLSAEEARCEQAIQQALQTPGSVDQLPVTETSPQPVYLWLHPAPPVASNQAQPLAQGKNKATKKPEKRKKIKDKRRRQGERVDDPDGKTGLLSFRLESLFTMADYVKVDRTTDDETDLEKAEMALDDMQKISVSRDNEETGAAALEFELDLPPSEYEEEVLPEGITLPEWDYRKQQMRPDYCYLQNMLPEEVSDTELPQRLRKMARRLRQEFDHLQPTRVWHRGQPEGSEIDMDAYLGHLVNRQLGHASSEENLYKDFRGGKRNLACLLLADLSMSTDAWVNSHARIVDVIQDSLFLFSEALSATGDQFALYGFCSNNHTQVQFQVIKPFHQTYNNLVRGRIQALKPGFYTRMGAAIRYATQLLSEQQAEQRLLLLLTDGKPNDIDQYEGRYGIEDTRVALLEARKKGLQPFCITIDEQANDYLPHIFGANRYVLIRNPSDLPKELPLLYAHLTRE
ncbi:nitric oxide reductase activation protein NorD [Candidatus Venteria ishoeyi]|uniref:von Willebrand factor type A domain protein n=1 Tax=Candidatus Venteria ishoeyi TaxID=1899563 RepID=A0A1H6F399_9GAMM|nr:VWA domain-containing protein [Candidatus Venteria ishoeyi]MDM8545658.1 VWA domain-containing protein [Candidatus Venteria ishoeyi]SEH04552.1 von Willebrand factor type A domain protein [Candidatus Venteria ishoeyi]